MTGLHPEVSPATAIRLVAQRELNTRMRTRSFLLGTALIIALLGGYVMLQATLISDADRVSVGLSGQASNVAEPLRRSAEAVGLDIETSHVTSADEARAKVRSGDLDAVVSGNAAALEVLVKTDLDSKVQTVLTAISQREVLGAALAQAGVEDPGAALAEAEATRVQVIPLIAPDPERGQRNAVGVLTVVLLFFAVSTYGTYVAQGVVEEKSSRVVEILLASVQPWHLLLGKIIGIGLVGLVQMVVIAAVGIALAGAAGVLTISGVAVSILAWAVLWYVLGWFLYATLFAAAGSLVSRQEDAQGVLMPLTAALMIGFVVGLNLMAQDPNSATAAALSLVPPLSPILMPGRIATGDVALWEHALAVTLTLATVAVSVWLGSRVYRNAVLRTGSRVRLSDALRG